MVTTRRPKKAVIQLAVSIAVAVVLGVIAIGLMFTLVSFLTNQNNQLATQAEQEKVALQKELQGLKSSLAVEKSKYEKHVVATKMIPAGFAINPSDVEEQALDKGQTIEEGALKTKGVSIGRVAAVSIQPGEEISERKLMKADILVRVPEGKRAIGITVSPVGLVAGSIQPGMRADILATFSKSKIVRTLLQDIAVLGVSPLQENEMQVVSTGKTEKKDSVAYKKANVILEVTPTQAEMLALGNEEATYYLTLRNVQDHANPKLLGTDMGQMISGIHRSPQTAGWQHATKPKLPSIKTVGYNVAQNPSGLPSVSLVDEQHAAKNTPLEVIKGAEKEQVTFETTLATLTPPSSGAAKTP